jgi:hypothetical protein
VNAARRRKVELRRHKSGLILNSKEQEILTVFFDRAGLHSASVGTYSLFLF